MAVPEYSFCPLPFSCRDMSAHMTFNTKSFVHVPPLVTSASTCSSFNVLLPYKICMLIIYTVYLQLRSKASEWCFGVIHFPARNCRSSIYPVRSRKSVIHHVFPFVSTLRIKQVWRRSATYRIFPSVSKFRSKQANAGYTRRWDSVDQFPKLCIKSCCLPPALNNGVCYIPYFMFNNLELLILDQSSALIQR